MIHVVVVLSYFGREDTVRCVESLVTGNRDATVLVVDNGSYDGVLDAISSTFPSVETLQLSTNTGFSGGMNAGIRHAIALGADVVTVLNNDTVVADGVTARLAGGAVRGYLLSPEVRYLRQPTEVWFGGGTIDAATGLARHERPAEWGAVDRDGYRESETLAGCCLSAATHTWQRLGLFDERYFLNFEDSDLSLRATAERIPLRVDTRAVIHHAVSASFTGAYSYLGLYYYCRNGLLFSRERVGADTRARYRFLRRHVAPALRDAMRRGPAPGSRALLTAVVAILDDRRRRYGPAPSVLTRSASRWAAADRPGRLSA